MIEFVYRKDHSISANASGNIAEIATELGLLFNTAYNLMRSRSPEHAEAFKRGVLLIMQPDSPVWDKEDIPDPQNGIKLVRVLGRGREDHHDENSAE